MKATVTAPVYDARRVNDLLSLGYTKKKLASFRSPPVPVRGYYTFFDPCLPLLVFRDLPVVRRRNFIYHQTWYEKKDWARNTGTPRYRQLRLPVPDSFDKTFREQTALLLPNEELPTVCSVAILILIHALATRKRLLSECCVRCSEKDSGGYPVVVGGFRKDGFIFDRYCGDGRNAYLGLAASQKS